LFSATDAHGVIRTANAAFARISGHPVDELRGAPHDLVRHPGTPSGVFHLMWERLHAGRPVAAYLGNRARDGSSYWVFATVAPAADGFLSVQVAPRGPLLEPVRRMYAEVRAVEEEARQAGTPAADAAAAGAAELLRRLAELGYADPDALAADALPVEMAVRSRYARPDRPGGDVLAATLAVQEHLATLVRRLDSYGRLATALDATSRPVLAAADELGEAVAAACAAGERIGGPARVLVSVAGVTERLAREVVDILTALIDDLVATRRQLDDLRFRLALAALHTDAAAAAQFDPAVETADGEPPDDVALLGEALHDGVAALAAALPEVTDRLAELGQRAERAVETFRNVRTFTGQWRALVYRSRQQATVADHLDAVDRHLNESHAQLADLARLGAACRAETAPVDLAPVQELLAPIRAARHPVPSPR
jgi:aerotaxis receptor